jgi:glycosyltransferase involved in cell wall biosynthesis
MSTAMTSPASSDKPAAAQQISSIDLVVPTIGRTDEVGRLLDSVAQQRWPGELRVILVDQNADDRLVAIVEERAGRLDVLHLRAPQLGASHACNVGFEACRADLVGRPDDDCWYLPDTIDRAVAAFDGHPEWDAVCGMTCDSSGRPSQLRWDRAGGIVTRRNVFRRAIGATLFVRRDALEAIGPWDESYGPRPHADGTISGGSEDGEYILRMLGAGLTLGFEPGLRIVHDDFRPPLSDGRSMRKAYVYGVDHSRLLAQYAFPRRYMLWRSAQLLAGSALFLARGEPGRARFYAAMARGRLRGMLAGAPTPTSAERPACVSRS